MCVCVGVWALADGATLLLWISRPCLRPLNVCAVKFHCTDDICLGSVRANAQNEFVSMSNVLCSFLQIWTETDKQNNRYTIFCCRVTWIAWGAVGIHVRGDWLFFSHFIILAFNFNICPAIPFRPIYTQMLCTEFTHTHSWTMYTLSVDSCFYVFNFVSMCSCDCFHKTLTNTFLFSIFFQIEWGTLHNTPCMH